MRHLTIGLLMTAAIVAAVVLLPATQADAIGVRVRVGGFYPGYYGPYPYAAGYRGYYAPPVRVYAYRPPVIYAPAPPVVYAPTPSFYAPPPVYVPSPAYVPLPPRPPCIHYQVWER